MLIDKIFYGKYIEYIILFILSIPLAIGLLKYFFMLRKNTYMKKSKAIDYLLSIAMVFISLFLYAYQDEITRNTKVWIVIQGEKNPVKIEKVLLFKGTDFYSVEGKHFRIKTNPSGYAVVNDSDRILILEPVVYSQVSVLPEAAQKFKNFHFNNYVEKGSIIYFQKLKYFGFEDEAPPESREISIQGNEPGFGRMELECWLRW
ncbi:MAG: hypothetical protein V1874_08885 [Spirochaetota bacterium]